MKHEKKVWPEYFQKIIDGNKTYELRLADWKCEQGDAIVLKEWDPKTKKYTGRAITKKAGSVEVFKIDKLFWPKEEIEKHGLMTISLKEPTA